MKLNPLLVAVGFALLAASCGVSRDADLADSPTASNEAAATSGESQTDDDGGPASTPTTVVAAPATTGPAGDVAVTVVFPDGESIKVRHGELNDVVVSTQDNQEFIDLVYGGQLPPGFAANVLSQNILGQAINNQLASLQAAANPEDEVEARTLLGQQLQGLLTTAVDPAVEAERLYNEVPYLQFLVGLQARQISLSNFLASNAPAGEGNPCVRHILVDTEVEGDTLQADLAAGADFGELAVERSTGPSGPTGGDLGCAAATNYVPEFAAAIEGAEPGAYIGPIETQFGWHVLVVDKYEVDGDELAQVLLSESLGTADVDVDERVGTWDVDRLTIVPVGS